MQQHSFRKYIRAVYRITKMDRCQMHLIWPSERHRPNVSCFRGFAFWPPDHGLCPWILLWALPQTPIIDLCSVLSVWAANFCEKFMPVIIMTYVWQKVVNLLLLILSLGCTGFSTDQQRDSCSRICPTTIASIFVSREQGMPITRSGGWVDCSDNQG